VLTGDAKDRLVDAILAEIANGKTQDEDGVSSYPENLKSPYRERRFECGIALYKALGIGRDDKQRRIDQWEQNYRFFGATVGILFTLNKQMEAPQYLDLGIYVQTIMLAAQEAGLSTCSQRSWGVWPTTCGKALGIPNEERVILGMALGYGDHKAQINQYRVGRAELDEVSEFQGF